MTDGLHSRSLESYNKHVVPPPCAEDCSKEKACANTGSASADLLNDASKETSCIINEQPTILCQETSVEASDVMLEESELTHPAADEAELQQGTTSPRGRSWPDSLQVFDMHLHEDEHFDPNSPEVREVLLKLLGVSSRTVIDPMVGFAGGCNEGIWFLREPSSLRGDLVLKLVRGTRRYPEFPTETENLLRLYDSYPDVVNDQLVAFPFYVVRIVTASSQRFDLLIMRKAPGETFANHITMKCCIGQMDKLKRILEQIGKSLRQFQRSYGGQQHGDLQPSNIFVDDKTGAITFIDIGGIGMPTVETDAEHFEKSMRLCYGGYGPELMVVGMAHFLEGLASRPPA
jgi:hypothetical protein